MAEFGAAATLEVSVSDSELRAARSRIEDELGDVEVGVSTPPSRTPPGTAMSDGGLGSVDALLSAQLEALEDIHEELETIGASGGMGGGGGGGGAGGTILAGLGARSLLAGGTAAGVTAAGTTALAAGSIVGTGAMIGKGARNVMQGQFPDAYAPSSEGISGTSYAYTEEDGIGGSAEPVINPEEIQQSLSGLEFPQPDWVSMLDQGIDFAKPPWLQQLEQVQQQQPSWMSNLNPFGGGGGGSSSADWSNVPSAQRKRYQNETGTRDTGFRDLRVDVGGVQFDMDPNQLQREIERAVDDLTPQIVDQAVQEVQDLVPGGGF